MKARNAETGFSENFSREGLLLDLLDSANLQFDQNTGEVKPILEVNDVTDFSKGRFGPLLANNEEIAEQVSSTDSVSVKRFRKATLYLRGARSTGKIEGMKKTSSQLKSVPVDRVVFDEVEEMEPAMVDLALERMAHFTIKEEAYLSTPSIPDFGIDRLYSQGDQRI